MTDQNGQLEDDDRWLAAEYALGILDGPDRHLVASRAKRDAAFEAEVREWENRFAPMLEAIPPKTVPHRVWISIEAEIGRPAPSAPRQTAAPGLWSNTAFWRWVSFGTGALAAASLAGLLVLLPGTELLGPRDRAPLVATLNAKGDVPVFVVRFDSTRSELFIRASAADKTDARVPELWVIPDDGTPRSLGVLTAGESARVVVPKSLGNVMRAGVTLAISLEPAGGSPPGAPTGPVIASGNLLAL